MGIIGKILPRVNVLVAVFSDREHYRLWLVRCPFGKANELQSTIEELIGKEPDAKEMASFPVMVLIGGYGVISKHAGALGEIESRISDPGGDLLGTRQGDEISFVRRDQLSPLDGIIENSKAKIVSVQCFRWSADQTEEEIVSSAAQLALQYRNTLTVGSVLRPTREGSALGQLVAGKLMLPVLGLLFAALVINMLVSSGLRSRSDAAAVELYALERTSGRSEDTSRRQQDMLREYNRALPHRMSWLCDRIGSVVPDGMLLTSLWVQPPTRNIEKNRKSIFLYDTVEISGESPRSATVSGFINNLNDAGVGSRVTLSSMEQDRESGSFSFKITLRL